MPETFSQSVISPRDASRKAERLEEEVELCAVAETMYRVEIAGITVELSFIFTMKISTDSFVFICSSNVLVLALTSY